jgi:hypothetical protein
VARRLEPPAFGDSRDSFAKRRRAANELELLDAAGLVDQQPDDNLGVDPQTSFPFGKLRLRVAGRLTRRLIDLIGIPYAVAVSVSYATSSRARSRSVARSPGAGGKSGVDTISSRTVARPGPAARDRESYSLKAGRR